MNIYPNSKSKKFSSPIDSSSSSSEDEDDYIEFSGSNNGQIKDPGLFPRCEYNAKYEDTTYYEMTNPRFWGTYHRSNNNRLFVENKNSGVTFCPQKISNKSKKMSFYPHVGGYYDPFKHHSYTKNILGNKQLNDKKSSQLRNKTLEYKNKICKEIIRLCTEHYKIDVGYHDNEYPCINISLLNIDRPTETKYLKSKKKFKQVSINEEEYGKFKQFRKHFQNIIMAYFVGLLNHNASIAQIPIECVIRSGFGHNTPSVDVLDYDVRLNIGIVPLCYTRVVAKSIYETYSIVYRLFTTASHLGINPEVSVHLCETFNHYNHIKQQIYKKRLWQHQLGNREAKPREPKKVELGETYWSTLKGNGSSKGGLFIAQLVKYKENAELLSYLVMDALNKYDNWLGSNEIEEPIIKLFDCIKVGKNSLLVRDGARKKIQESFNKKFKFNPKENADISKDDNFWQLIYDTFNALGNKDEYSKRPSRSLLGLYKFWEKTNADFITQYSPADRIDITEGYGSDSDIEVDFKGTKLQAKKIVTTTGMLSINLAYLAAEKFMNKTKLVVSCNNMYYETKDCLKHAINPPTRFEEFFQADVLFYDLNHCKTAENRLDEKIVGTKVTLETEFQKAAPCVVVLDCASSTDLQINNAITYILNSQHQRGKAQLILLVSSGLKNETGGSDYCPFGTLRILLPIRDNMLKGSNQLELLYRQLTESLTNYTSAVAHKIRISYKYIGYGQTNKNILNAHLGNTNFSSVEDKAFLSKRNNIEQIEGSGTNFKDITDFQNIVIPTKFPKLEKTNTYNIPSSYKEIITSSEGEACLFRAFYAACYPEMQNEYANMESKHIRGIACQSIKSYLANASDKENYIKLLTEDLKEYLKSAGTARGDELLGKMLEEFKLDFLKTIINTTGERRIELIEQCCNSLPNKIIPISFWEFYIDSSIAKRNNSEGESMISLLTISLKSQAKLYYPHGGTRIFGMTQDTNLIHIKFTWVKGYESTRAHPNHYNALLP